MTETKKQNYPAKVLEILDNGNRLVINKGSADGIHLGQNFLVYAMGDELFDPDTQERLGQLEIVKGTGHAIHVQPRLTTLVSNSTQKYVTSDNPLWGLQRISIFGEKKREETAIRPFDAPEKGDLVKPI